MKQQTLVIRRAIAAPREQVFNYLTIPEKMAKWFYGMDVGQAKATVDLRPGGKCSMNRARGASPTALTWRLFRPNDWF